MDENNRTDKALLTKGLKRMGICLVLMFAGPSLLYLALSNDGKPLYIPLLIISILICIAAIAMLFIGLNTIGNSMFKKK
ncbi:MAG: hypothetical protein HRU49_12370 [Winogradskyella sp.]|uniref:DUF6095 family protein n=1 Tax=Winogradskyella sp. TaxID=1883156 RepID=UPI0025F099CD|nr:DUF6095 family protein [Winogradskyella sp.]NRB84549.1 hypothetical protein [Winogradskyella sp.]